MVYSAASIVSCAGKAPFPYAPSNVASHSLAQLCCFSCARRAGGKQWMKSMLDIESPLSKELKQFLHSSNSWEALLDLSNSCRKVRLVLSLQCWLLCSAPHCLSNGEQNHRVHLTPSTMCWFQPACVVDASTGIHVSMPVSLSLTFMACRTALCVRCIPPCTRV